jgi:hypothetical protein
MDFLQPILVQGIGHGINGVRRVLPIENAVRTHVEEPRATLFTCQSKLTCNIHVKPPGLLTTSPDDTWPPSTSKVHDSMRFESFYLLGYRSIGCEITR